MTNEQVMSKLQFVVYGEDLNRVQVIQGRDGEMVIRINTHEMKCKAANRVLNNIISMFKCPFTLDVIHGYNHGTVIKDMIQDNIINQRIIAKKVLEYNPGETLIKVAA